MNFLSIDIGIKNLGFAIYYQIGSEETNNSIACYLMPLMMKLVMMNAKRKISDEIED